MTGDGAAVLLEIDGLTVRRHRELLLEEVGLRVRRGDIHVLMGPNGAGKSTLLAAVLGQIPFDGQIAMNWLGDGRIGYVPQSFAVDPTLPVTVGDFLAVTRQRRPVCLGLTGSSRTAIARMLEQVGLPGLDQRPLAVLSGGELRRVLLAHALDPEPELLILDEPTAGLDESAVRTLDEMLIAAKQRGRTTVLMVSHDQDQVRRVADRVTVLDRRVIAEGATDILAAASARGLLPAVRERRVARA
ncbi:MAG: metal ABC transporter ATP-binding protein [Acidobacteriota bacterium]